MAYILRKSYICTVLCTVFAAIAFSRAQFYSPETSFQVKSAFDAFLAPISYTRMKSAALDVTLSVWEITFFLRKKSFSADKQGITNALV